MHNIRSGLFLSLPKVRIEILLLACALFLGLQTGAYAQEGASFTVASIPRTFATATDHTAVAGEIVFTQASGISADGELTITYPAAITYDLIDGPISVIGTGVYAEGGAWFDTESSRNYDDSGHGILVIHVNSGIEGSGTIIVTGVRLDIASSGVSSVSASISATSNTINYETVTVISSVATGIASLNGIAGEINAGTGAVTASPWVGAKEGYPWAFDLTEVGDTTRVMVRFKLDQPPPAGVTVMFPANAVASSEGSSSVWETADSYGNSLSSAVDMTNGSTELSVYYKTNTTQEDSSFFYQETLSVPVTLAFSGSGPLSPITVSYTASLAPIGPAFDGEGYVIPSPMPRFAEALAGPATLFTVTGSPGLPLSPIAELLNPGGGTNVYEFDDNLFNYKVTYNPFTPSDGDVFLVVQPILITQDDLDTLVDGSEFEGANLVPYGGTGGFGVLFRVTCEDGDHVPIDCPVPVGTYDVQTAWEPPPSGQTIVAPAFLKAPVGTSDWEDILLSYYEDKIDGTGVGRTCCRYSDFVFVDMAGSGSSMGTTLPTININSPADGVGYTISQPVLADYSCSGTGLCVGTVGKGLPIDTSSLGTKTFDVTATAASGSSSNPSVNYIRSATYYVVAYSLHQLYDPNRAVKKGATYPIKLQVFDVDGNNISSPNIPLTAVNIVKIDNKPDGPLEDSGNSNPDNNFRFDPALSGGGYIYNLSTKGLSSGTYKVAFVVGADPAVQYAVFNVK